VLGSEPRRVRPDWFQASMQTPSRPRVCGQMDVGRAGLLPDLQIVIHVPQRMRFDGKLWRLSDHGRCRNNYAAWPSAYMLKGGYPVRHIRRHLVLSFSAKLRISD